MVVRPHGARDYVKGNKQSCSDLVQYLSKENEGLDLVKQEFFFNNKGMYFNNLSVTESIDNNVKGLHKESTKFFMLTVNPSPRELNHLTVIASGREVDNISELTPKELTKYNDLLKDYTNNVMELYAAGFNKNLTAQDLLYYAKVEQERHYTHNDEALSRKVETLKNEGKNFSTIVSKLSNERQLDIKNYYNNGVVVEGDKKPGLQTHVHIVVSRMDGNMKTSISPLANSRGKGNPHILNGKEVKVGFDRVQFKQDTETLFDTQFGYQREYKEYFSYSRGNQQTCSISATQINHYLSNTSKFKGIHEQDMGQKESMKAYRLAQSISNKDPKHLVENVLKIGQYDNLQKGDLGRMDHGQFLKFAASLAKGNPVSIVKEALQVIKTTLSHEI
jgi:diadenosine tetraphosphate (Ap4A) HIT family hydrolase